MDDDTLKKLYQYLGARGGRAKTAAKRKAALANIKKAQAARWKGHKKGRSK